jgi:hypothetical protein
VAKKKSSEDRLVAALAEILPAEKFQALSYSFVKVLTNEAIVRKANKPKKDKSIAEVA